MKESTKALDFDRSSLTRDGSDAVLANFHFVEDLYLRWREDPSSVEGDWAAFFKGFDFALGTGPGVSAEQAHAQAQADSLISNYRNLGHRIAQLDPLGNNPTSCPDLELERFGFTENDLDLVFDSGTLAGYGRLTLRRLLEVLRATYCGTVGVEYRHIQDTLIRRWLEKEMEPHRNDPEYSRERKMEILKKLIDAEIFETFIQSRYPGQKRFSLEGAESMIPGLDALIELAPELGVNTIMMGMAHRGRLNVLCNLLDKPYALIFGEFEDIALPSSVGGDGDVKYHRGYYSTRVTRNGKEIALLLATNPSHLEAVDPVVEGQVRAKQRRLGDTTERTRVLPVLIHGDAAFAGQGLVAETLNLSQLAGYRTGGTVHFIVNNQIGFTTQPHDARSTLYPTDVAKMVEAPIFHVNGDDPEAVVHVVELALRFRQEFHRDVVVDMICYRRHGHNEGDEPAFTQPVLYKKIKDRPSVRQLYTNHLVDSGAVSKKQGEKIANGFKARLQKAFESVKEDPPRNDPPPHDELWRDLHNPYSHEPCRTGVEHELLERTQLALSTIPENFRLNPKVARKLPETLEAVRQRKTLDWAACELLAFGTLLAEGTPVRLSGQDSARGTFSHRHSVWTDMETQEPHKPLNHIGSGQARFCVYNSMLSEAAVLGFDYGYSLGEPMMLVVWEAQFGDFANGAQVIIDQFIVSSQSKWNRASGLVMLLPHGYEGQGPEHSNAYLERYLAACAEENIQVCNLTTPAQYFHVLRRQVRRNFRRPLIIMTPKSLLRHPRVVSPVEDLLSGSFQEILPDSQPPERTRRVILCSGKVYYDLVETREAEKIDDVAIVRVEQFYPLHKDALVAAVRRHGDFQDLVWTQEEPQNRGGWPFMFPHLLELFPERKPGYVGRRASASPATGSARIHRSEQETLVRKALGLE